MLNTTSEMKNLEVCEKAKKSMALISVIMPTYNYAQFIGAAIDSVLKQTHQNIDLIIVDNFSRDDTESIVKSFKDSRIRYYKFANNGVIAASRNFGIKASRGEYIAFIDSDDFWYPEKLNTQLTYLQQHPDIALVSCSLLMRDTDGKYADQIAFKRFEERRGYLYNELISFNFISCSAVLVRNLILNEAGYFDEDPDIYSVEDWNLWLTIAKKYKIAFIPEVVGVYKIHNSDCGVFVKRLEKAMVVIDRHLRRNWITAQQAKKAKASFYFYNGWFLIDKNARLARSLFYKAWKIGRGNVLSSCMSILGLLLSLFPSLSTFLKTKLLDKRTSNRISRVQNLLR